MAFSAPTYAASYDQTEQNANAVLITAAVNKLIVAAQKNQEAVAALLNLRQGDNFAAGVTAANDAKAKRDLLP